jgi:hypothetical protein
MAFRFLRIGGYLLIATSYCLNVAEIVDEAFFALKTVSSRVAVLYTQYVVFIILLSIIVLFASFVA